MKPHCKYCNDTGRIPAGWNYPAHRCQDCEEREENENQGDDEQ